MSALPARAHTPLRHLMLTGVLALLVVLSGALLSPSNASGTRVDDARSIVLNKIGDPYVWGAAGPNAFDCSGLMYYSFRRAGFGHMPRTAAEQSHFAHPISRSNMRPGDLMFFDDGSGVYHVAMFLGWRSGHRIMVDAPEPGQRVHIHAPWTNRWFPGTLR